MADFKKIRRSIPQGVGAFGLATLQAKKRIKPDQGFSTRDYLHGAQVIGGAIDPWGTIYISSHPSAFESIGVKPKPLSRNLVERGGLPLWSAKLIRYGTHDYFAEIVDSKVVIRRKNRTVDRIAPRDFKVVCVHECRVLPDGHLQWVLMPRDPARESDLARTARGERPKCLDNSMFVQISKEFAGRRVVELKIGCGLFPRAMVYTKRGKKVPCKFYYPLGYATWEPSDPLAAFSKKD